MNTLEKEFVPYQESLELKELGFDESCFGYFNTTSYLGIGSFVFKECDKSTIDGYGNKPLLRPTFSQAFRWFREKCFLFGYPFPNDYQNYGYRIVEMTSDENKELVYDWGTKDTYEEAELECLRKLIEIVKKHETN